jgi:mannose-6-phosphate isomerase
MNLYPLKFEPFLRTMVWGGDKIAPFKGISTNIPKIGESWEISAVKGQVSTVSNGPLKGRSLDSIVSEFKGNLVGRHVYEKTGDEFPLLIKFIDAKSDLSIQVHPDDALAEAKYGSKGKTEMWYIIGADPGAHLLSGLSEQITPEEYEERVKNNTITDVLASHAVKPGDVFFLPAGRIHAICSGCFLTEIQETSDITFRIYDYGRPGLDGKPRELHTEQAKEAIDYKVYPSYRTEYEKKKDAEVEVVDCDFFTTSVMDLDKPLRKDLSGTDSFLVVICIAGSGELVDEEPGGQKSETIRQGETVLIPASSLGVDFRPEGNLSLVTSWIR